jgi:hypothetical protein
MSEPTKTLWTEGDAQAEIMRLGQGTVEARKTLHRAVGEIRAVGKQSGFEALAEAAVERLRRGALGDDPPPAWVDRSCTICGFEFATRELEEGTCPRCAERLHPALTVCPRDGSPDWWNKIAEISHTLEGCMILALVRDPSKTDTQVVINDSPQVPIEARYLILDPAVGDGTLKALRIGHESLLIGSADSPLSVFNPRMWASPEAMLKTCALQSTRRITPAHRITLVAQLEKPGRFSAILWGRAFDWEGKPY